jgi:glycosyltransferase involved in cell wall biosynthesis
MLCKASKPTFEERVNRYPLVSVITPSFNQGEFIEETIKSVLSQDYPHIEYIVIDGGSTDNTLEILKKYSDKIRWLSESDKGQADAVNKGFSMAKGEILGWLNSDDTYRPGAMRKAVKAFLTNPAIIMVYGDAYFIDREGSFTGRYSTEPFDLRHLAEVCFICQPTVFLKSEVIKKIGMLDTNLQTCMDFDYWIRIGKKFDPSKISYLRKKFLANSRMYGENKSLGRSEKHYSEIMETAKKHFGYVSIRWICGYIYAVTLGKKRIERYQKVNFAKKSSIQLYFIFRLFAKRWAWIYFWKYIMNSISNVIGIYGETDQGALYGDGWVSRFCIISFEKEKDAHTLFLEGRHAWPDKDSLKIDVIINGEKVKVIYIKQKGKFKFALKVTQKQSADDLLMVMLKPRKTFAPRNHGMVDDRRRLSFILDKIELR